MIENKYLEYLSKDNNIYHDLLYCQDVAGIYVIFAIVNNAEKCLYIGESNNIKIRWRGSSHTRKNEINILKSVGITVYYKILSSDIFPELNNKNNRIKIELALINNLSPCWNNTPDLIEKRSYHVADESYAKEEFNLDAHIRLYSLPFPPVRNSNHRSKIQIPNIKITTFVFSLLKNTLSGYYRGKYGIDVTLSNKRRMRVYCNTNDEGLKLLNAIESLIYPSIYKYSLFENKSIANCALYPFSVDFYDKNTENTYKGFHLWKEHIPDQVYYDELKELCNSTKQDIYSDEVSTPFLF